MKIILFDGVCQLCEYSVNFIIEHDKNKHFYFASQTSERGKLLLKKHQLQEVDSIILIDNDKVFLYSDAALEIAQYLDGKWKHFKLFKYVPKIIRDSIYKIISKYRYLFFGKKEACLLPNKEILNRFL